jgi:hypothetical protein
VNLDGFGVGCAMVSGPWCAGRMVRRVGPGVRLSRATELVFFLFCLFTSCGTRGDGLMDIVQTRSPRKGPTSHSTPPSLPFIMLYGEGKRGVSGIKFDVTERYNDISC